jgi:hypothetical protein
VLISAVKYACMRACVCVCVRTCVCVCRERERERMRTRERENEERTAGAPEGLGSNFCSKVRFVEVCSKLSLKYVIE